MNKKSHAAAYRPQTGTTAGPLTRDGGLPINNSFNRFTQQAAFMRAASAGIQTTEKGQRSQVLINRLKKKLQDERRMHRTMRTMLAHEIESKNVLEKVLRLCVDDVKSEILKKQHENKQ